MEKDRKLQTKFNTKHFHRRLVTMLKLAKLGINFLKFRKSVFLFSVFCTEF